ncbi:hypothetical protein CEXT_521661 [Caerostris extrusa]|uniref:Uncharacterized protein n=1 Tax=Caerostris extrusa TaxID=172846 RepID=A0AAV4SQX3_CAEEX|nr:hypothetical protein CEXT_521661 [Caerostris extrusa]
MALAHTHSRNSRERKATLKCIPGKSSQPFLITNETPTTCPLALKVTSRSGRQQSFTDIERPDMENDRKQNIEKSILCKSVHICDG